MGWFSNGWYVAWCWMCSKEEVPSKRRFTWCPSTRLVQKAIFLFVYKQPWKLSWLRLFSGISLYLKILFSFLLFLGVVAEIFFFSFDLDDWEAKAKERIKPGIRGWEAGGSGKRSQGKIRWEAKIAKEEDSRNHKVNNGFPISTRRRVLVQSRWSLLICNMPGIQNTSSNLVLKSVPILMF